MMKIDRKNFIVFVAKEATDYELILTIKKDVKFILKNNENG